MNPLNYDYANDPAISVQPSYDQPPVDYPTNDRNLPYHLKEKEREQFNANVYQLPQERHLSDNIYLSKRQNPQEPKI